MAANRDYDAPRHLSMGAVDNAQVLPAALLEGPDRAGRVDREEFERVDLADQGQFDDGVRALSLDELTMPVRARGVDEAVCPSCFLIYPKSRILIRITGQPVCRDCAS